MTPSVRRYMREIGGRKSDAKTAAARANARQPRPRRRKPCVTGVTPEDHQRTTCPECRRAARMGKKR